MQHGGDPSPLDGLGGGMKWNYSTFCSEIIPLIAEERGVLMKCIIIFDELSGNGAFNSFPLFGS